MARSNHYNSGYNGYQPNYVTGSVNQFENHGHPGKYVHAQTVAASRTVSFTGSNAGASGIIISGSSIGTAGQVTFTGGGQIEMNVLTPNTLYEFSVQQVTTPAATTAVVLFAKRPVQADSGKKTF